MNLRILLKKAFFIFFIMISLYAELKAQSSLSFVYNKRDDISVGFPDSGLKPYYWNSGILTLGWCFDSTLSIEGTTITFSDTLGNINWKKVYFYPSSLVFDGMDIIALNNSSFYVVGGIYKDTINSYDSFFAKFDSNGDSLFVKQYTDTTNSAFIDIETFSSDTLLVLNPLQINYGDEYSQIGISKLDTAGNILHSSSSSFSLNGAYQIIKGSNNKIYVGGTRKTNPGSSYNLKVFINVYNYNLNQIATWNPSLTTNEYFQALNIWNNQLYLSSLVTVFDPPNQNDFLQCRFGKINPLSGNYSSYTNIGALQFGGRIGVFQPDVINNNVIAIPIVGGTRDSLYLVDTIPSLICHTSLEFTSTPTGEQTMGIVVLPNKKIAGTGILSAPQDHWNFLTENMETYLVSNCGSTGVTEFNETKEIYNVYPTLFNEILTIKCIENCSGKFTATLFNGFGQEVVNALGSNELLLNTFNFQNGIYYLRIYGNNRYSVFKLIKTN